MPALLPLVLLAVTAAAPASTDIVRHPNPAAPIILGGVTLPPGAELLMLSGQVPSPIDPAKANTLEDFGDTKTQTLNVLSKIKAQLTELGYSMSDVVKLTVFVVGDPRLGGKMDFAGFNDGYKMFFGTAENPNLVARSTVQIAALANPNWLIEIEATAARLPKATSGKKK
ncbi:MAG: RidA family protein [Cystobacter sp.]